MNKLSRDLLTIVERISNKEKEDKKTLKNYEESKYEENKYCDICNRPFNFDKKVNITKTLRKSKIIITTQENSEGQHIQCVFQNMKSKEIYLS